VAMKTKPLNRSLNLFSAREVEKVRYKYLLLVMFALLVSSSFMVGASTVSTSVIKNQINFGDAAEFSLTIDNSASITRRYSLYSLQSTQGWSVDPTPLKDRIIEIGPNKEYTTKILVRPIEQFSPGVYYVIMNIEGDSGERFTESLKVYLAPESNLDYLPSIKADLDMDEKINPKGPVSIKLFLENKNPLHLSDLIIKIESDMVEFNKELLIELPPLEKKTVEFTVNPDHFQQPKDYNLFFVFERNGQTVKVINKKIEIIPLIPNFELSVTDEMKFFKKFSSVIFRNDGNVINIQEVGIPVSFWQSLFIKGDAGTVKKISGQRFLMWEIELNPNESIAMDVITNYRVIFYFLIALLVFLIFYTIVKSPISVVKKAVTHKGGEGVLSQIKITLEVKNKSKKSLKNIVITDLVPTIANVEKNLELLGTLKPKDIHHTKKGTKVTWALAELDGLEHRIITYKIKCKLNVLGTFSLPRTVVEFGKGKRKSKAYSNLFKVRN
jgi:hypothetical protein